MINLLSERTNSGLAEEIDPVIELLANYFPLNYLVYFWEIVGQSIKRFDIVDSLTGVVKTKNIPCYRAYRSGDKLDKTLLLLVFMFLVLGSKGLVIPKDVLVAINESWGFHLSEEWIKSHYSEIKKCSPSFYRGFDPIKSVGPNPRLLKEVLVGKLEVFNRTIDLDDTVKMAIIKRSLEIYLLYIKHPRFKFRKVDGFGSTSLAIIAEAYSQVTGGRGLPFILRERQQRTVYSRRTDVRRCLREITNQPINY